jgi:hypothetical protein
MRVAARARWADPARCVRRFFDGHRVTVEKAPNCARRKHRAVICPEKLSKLDQRDVVLTLDRRKDRLSIGFDPL